MEQMRLFGPRPIDSGAEKPRQSSLDPGHLDLREVFGGRVLEEIWVVQEISELIVAWCFLNPVAIDWVRRIFMVQISLSVPVVTLEILSD